VKNRPEIHRRLGRNAFHGATIAQASGTETIKARCFYMALIHSPIWLLEGNRVEPKTAQIVRIRSSKTVFLACLLLMSFAAGR
jgi:hypothetical protein